MLRNGIVFALILVCTPVWSQEVIPNSSPLPKPRSVKTVRILPKPMAGTAGDPAKIMALWQASQEKCSPMFPAGPDDHDKKACASAEKYSEELAAMDYCPIDEGPVRVWERCAVAHVMAGEAARGADPNDPNNSLGDQTRNDFLTQEGGLMCDFPGHMGEAGQAVTDPKWLKNIGCVLTRAGLKVIRTEDRFPLPHGEWRVRVFTENGDSETMYTYSCDLAFMDGAKVRICY